MKTGIPELDEMLKHADNPKNREAAERVQKRIRAKINEFYENEVKAKLLKGAKETKSNIPDGLMEFSERLCVESGMYGATVGLSIMIEEAAKSVVENNEKKEPEGEVVKEGAGKGWNKQVH